MKRIVTLILFALLLGACASNESDQASAGNEVAGAAVVHESNGLLAERKITPQHTVVLQLEASLTHDNDTHGIGSDTFQLVFSAVEDRDYCYNNDLGAGHRLTIEDSAGQLLVELTSGCRSVRFQPGEYQLRLFNADQDSGIEHTVFVYPAPDVARLSRPDKGRAAKSDISDAALRKQTIVGFNICHGCDLHQIDLSRLSFDQDSNNYYLYPRMNNAYFSKLDTTEAVFFDVQNQDTYAYKVQPLDLSGSNLYGADLSYSIFKNANFDGVNFDNANLSNAVFLDCSFKGANFSNVNMQRSVFIRPQFDEEYTLPHLAVISQPSTTDLFKDQTTHNWGSITSFVAENNRLYLTSRIYASLLVNLPDNLVLDSPPAIVPNNFTTGYSVFVKGSDGYLWEYFHGSGVHGKGDWIPEIGWHKLGGVKADSNKDTPTATNKCTSKPDASFGNFGGHQNANELYVVVACLGRENEGAPLKLYTWHRYFYNKKDSAGNSQYGNWKHEERTTDVIARLSADIDNISIHNSQSSTYFRSYNIGFAFVDDNGMHVYDGPSDSITSYTPEDVSGRVGADFSSRAELLTEHDFYIAVVMDDGRLYVGRPGAFSDYGHPDNGIIATPALGRFSTNHTLVVLSGDGKLYSKPLANPAADWSEISLNTAAGSSQFVFRNNDLTEAYLEAADFSDLNLSDNNFTRTFLTKSTLQNSIFDGAELLETAFDDSILNSTSFRSAQLVNAEFSNNRDTDDHNVNNKNMVNADFSSSRIDGLSWINNIAECANFDHSTFTNAPVIANTNRFISGADCRTSFRLAGNIPVELFYDQNADQISGQDASFLRYHDFSSAGFKNITQLDFIGADMSNARFGGSAHDGGVDLNALDATGSNWTNADLSFLLCESCRFDQAVFDNSSLYQARMNGSSFVQASLTDSNASYAQFQQGSLDLLTVTGSSSLVGSSFIKSSLQGGDLSSIDLTNTRFNDANLMPYSGDLATEQVNTNLSSSNLTGANLKKAIVVCADLSQSNFTNSDFSGAYLNGANLSSPVVNISGADFSAAHLNAVNFQHLAFADSDLTDAVFDFTNTSVVDGEGDVLCDTGASGGAKPDTGSSTICPDGLYPAVECQLP